MATFHGSMTDDGSRRFRIGRLGGEKTGEAVILELLKEKPETTDTRRRFDTRTKPDGKSWTFEVFAAIDGFIADVYTQPREIQGITETILMLDLKDGIDLYRIEVDKFDGRYSQALLSRLADPNFKLADRFRLAPYAFTDKETNKARIGVTCWSGANKLTARRADEAAGFLPPEPTQTVFKGETLWDWEPVAKYLYEWVKFNVFHGGESDPFKPVTPTPPAPISVPSPTEDLPF